MYLNEKQKGGRKIKIILFAMSVVVIIFLILNIINLVRGLFNEINRKNYEFKCKSLRYDVKVIYKDDSNIKLDIINNDIRINITSLEISEYNLKKEIFIKHGESYKILLPLINNSNNSLYIRINNCSTREVKI